MVHLGDQVKDKLTGLKGTAVARTEYLHGCVRVSIQPREVKDGKPAEWVSVDEPQLEIIVANHAEPAAPRHGPNPAATRTPDASR